MYRGPEEPTMSDATILVTVEDLIDRAMGPPDANKVDFKIVQMILEILAKQQRMLNQRIEIRVIEPKKELSIEKTRRYSSKRSSKTSSRTEPLTAIKERPKSSRRHDSKDEEQKLEDKSTGKESGAERKDMDEKYVEGNKPKSKDKEGEQEMVDKLSHKDKLENENDKEKRNKQESEKMSESEYYTSEEIAQKDQKILEKDKTVKEKFEKMSNLDILRNKETQSDQDQEEKRKQEKVEKMSDEKTLTKPKSVIDGSEVEKKEQEKVEKMSDEETLRKIKSVKDGSEVEKREQDKVEKMSDEETLRTKKSVKEGLEVEKREQEKVVKITSFHPEEEDEEKHIQITPKVKKISEKEEIKEIEQEKKRHKKDQAKERYNLSAEEKGELKITAATSSIEITEKQIDDEKVLVVEKGPTTRKDSRSSKVIDFVTRSQLALVKAAVKELIRLSIAAPQQLPLPGNEKLISDVMKGTASLPETMQALQVKERMKVAEESMIKTIEMLTQLASTGALPEDIAEQVESIIPPKLEEAVKSPSLAEKKSVAADLKATLTRASPSQASETETTHVQDLQDFTHTPEPSLVQSGMSVPTADFVVEIPCVTHADMRAALKELKDNLIVIINKTIDKTSAVTEAAQNISKIVANKLNSVMNLDNRISVLQSLTEEYINQYSGVGISLNATMQSYEGIIAQMRQIISNGVDQLKNVNKNAETEAIMTLMDQYEEMETTLDNMLFEHKAIMDTQTEFTSNMRSLWEYVNMLREEKANRDDVREALTYKANRNQLEGLLTGVEFAAARADFEQHIDQTHERFHQSVAAWDRAVEDLKRENDTKAVFLELLKQRDDIELQLQDLNSKIAIVSCMLGDPEIAIKTRKLSVDATCGSCHTTALMEPYDEMSGVPPLLPPLRKTPVEPSKEPFIPNWVKAEPSAQVHICRRWCGGSHTMAAVPSKHIQLQLQMQVVPTRKFDDYGKDGRLYLFEEELQPCIKCNALGVEPTQESARGEDEHKRSMDCSCHMIK